MILGGHPKLLTTLADPRSQRRWVLRIADAEGDAADVFDDAPTALSAGVR
jgi:hypothetical protein